MLRNYDEASKKWIPEESASDEDKKPGDASSAAQALKAAESAGVRTDEDEEKDSSEGPREAQESRSAVFKESITGEVEDMKLTVNDGWPTHTCM